MSIGFRVAFGQEEIATVARPLWWVWGMCFDLRRGVETTRRVPVPKGREWQGYEGFMRWSLTGVLPRSSVDSSDVFLDVGSGKGRAVLFAACHYAFRRVIGVEVSASLHRVATENVRRYRGQLAPIELINEDIQNWKIPNEVTVLFLYNPFWDSTFERFIGKVRQSLDECPREFRMIYENPQEHQMVIDAGFTPIRQFGRTRMYGGPTWDDPTWERNRARSPAKR